MTVERFLQALRAMEQQWLPVETPATTVEKTPRRAIGLILRRSGDLTEEERTALRQLTQLHPRIQATQALLEQFHRCCEIDAGRKCP